MTKPKINIPHKYNPQHITTRELSHNYYKIQYQQDWINFVYSWNLKLNSDANIDWLSKIAAPDSDFSKAITLANKEISNPTSTKHSERAQKITSSMIKIISKKIGLKSKPPKNSDSVKNILSFNDLLAQYRSALSALYINLQSILSNQQRQQLSLNYIQKILSNNDKNDTSPPLLHAVNIITKMLDTINDHKAKIAMQHLLMQPLVISWNIINKNACARLDEIWQQQVQQQFKNQLANYYPCNPHSNSDADPILLQQILFAKNQGLQLFLKNNIEPFLKHDPNTMQLTSPWITTNNGPFSLGINATSLEKIEKLSNLLSNLSLDKPPTFFYFHFAISAIPNPKITSLNIQLSKNTFSYQTQSCV
jgi:type VI protein secretion system component VasK